MKSQRSFNIALVGTDSLRGKEMKNVLENKLFPIQNIQFFDPDVEDEYSKLTQFRGEPKVISALDNSSLADSDLVFLASEKKINREYGKAASRSETKAVDLSESFSADKKVPIVVAGVNDEVIRKSKPNIVGNPHPVTIILSHLFNSVRSLGIMKTVSFILQPVSAFEEKGMEELACQSVAMMNSETFSKKVFKEQIAFNFLCQLEPSDEDGFSLLEKQIISEVNQVFETENFPFSLSLVQAPVFHTYSIMAFLELKQKIDITVLRDLFKQSPYFKVVPSSYSLPVSSVSIAGKEEIFIGQIKKEKLFPNSFWIWISADNLTRGSAVNALEIAETLLSSAQA
jgi:aspartate-semialdehyde dehydrogenase